MKNSALTFITLLISFFIFSQEKQAEIKFEVTTIDYGEVEFESDGKRVFKFKYYFFLRPLPRLLPQGPHLLS